MSVITKYFQKLGGFGNIIAQFYGDRIKGPTDDVAMALLHISDGIVREKWESIFHVGR